MYRKKFEDKGVSKGTEGSDQVSAKTVDQKRLQNDSEKSMQENYSINIERIGTDALEQLLKRPLVIEATGLPVSTLYRYMEEGIFPKPVKIGARSVAWKKSEVMSWINSRERALSGRES